MTSNNPPSRKPKPLIDKKTGKPVVNQYGHVVSARLTDEDEKAINNLTTKGYSKKAICEELALSERRVTTYLNKAKIAEAIALLYLVQEQAQRTDALLELMQAQTQIIAKLESRVSNIQTELQQTKKAATRNRIGREKAERSSRSQRQELTRLKQQLWKRTGRKP